MKTSKFTSKLNLKKETISELNMAQITGGDKKKSMTWTDPTANTFCFICDGIVVISKN